MKKFCFISVVIILSSLFIFSCSNDDKYRRTQPLFYKSKHVLLVKRVPVGCRVGKHVFGMGNSSKTKLKVWIWALNDIRNKSAKQGAQAVLYTRHVSYNPS